MTPSKEKITKVLSDGRVFYIPFYQRAYVWDEKMWRRFIRDMEYISHSDEEYFFGRTKFEYIQNSVLIKVVVIYYVCIHVLIPHCVLVI